MMIEAIEPGTHRYWRRLIGRMAVGPLSEYIPVTVVEDRGAWVIVEAEDGRHRVRPHNLYEEGGKDLLHAPLSAIDREVVKWDEFRLSLIHI